MRSPGLPFLKILTLLTPIVLSACGSGGSDPVTDEVPATDGGATDGSGGTTDGSDGPTDGSSGTTDGTGGMTDGTGGTTDGNGGATDGTGGAIDGTGGTTDGTGGTTDGSGGSTDGNSAAALSVVYADGGLIPGSDTATFTVLNTADLGDSGDVCFSAAYRDAGDNLQGVWCGPPGSPQLVLKTGDRIDNLAANIAFDRATELAISGDGQVYITAELSGASDGSAIIAWDGQETESLLRTGELAPGFTDASAIAGVSLAAISNSGIVISGFAGQFGATALWQWDGADISLITTFLPSVNTPLDQNNCTLNTDILGGRIQINNSGQIAFNATLSSTDQTTDTDLCRGTAVVLGENNSYTTILRSREPVPSTATATFGAPVLNQLFDSGAMSITSVLDDDNATGGGDIGRISTWILQPDGSKALFGIVQETIPPDFVDRISIVAHVPLLIASTESLAVQHVQTALGTSLLSGPPHSGNPYPDIGAVGATSMQLIASSNGESPDGQPETTFIGSFSRPAVDTNGRVYYRARIQRPITNTFTDAFYRYTQNNIPQLLFSTGEAIEFDGESRVIQSIEYNDAEILSFVVNNNPGVLISQQGDALVPITLENFGRALLYVTSQ